MNRRAIGTLVLWNSTRRMLCLGAIDRCVERDTFPRDQCSNLEIVGLISMDSIDVLENVCVLFES